MSVVEIALKRPYTVVAMLILISLTGIGAAERYNRGLTDFLNVVDAERQFYDLQLQYSIAQVAQGEQFVQLYKSLGGGWQDYQAIPAIRRPQPAVVAAFRRVLSRSTPP